MPVEIAHGESTVAICNVISHLHTQRKGGNSACYLRQSTIFAILHAKARVRGTYFKEGVSTHGDLPSRFITTHAQRASGEKFFFTFANCADSSSPCAVLSLCSVEECLGFVSAGKALGFYRSADTTCCQSAPGRESIRVSNPRGSPRLFASEKSALGQTALLWFSRQITATMALNMPKWERQSGTEIAFGQSKPDQEPSDIIAILLE